MAATNVNFQLTPQPAKTSGDNSLRSNYFSRRTYNPYQKTTGRFDNVLDKISNQSARAPEPNRTPEPRTSNDYSRSNQSRPSNNAKPDVKSKDVEPVEKFEEEVDEKPTTSQTPIEMSAIFSTGIESLLAVKDIPANDEPVLMSVLPQQPNTQQSTMLGMLSGNAWRQPLTPEEVSPLSTDDLIASAAQLLDGDELQPQAVEPEAIVEVGVQPSLVESEDGSSAQLPSREIVASSSEIVDLQPTAQPIESATNVEQSSIDRTPLEQPSEKTNVETQAPVERIDASAQTEVISNDANLSNVVDAAKNSRPQTLTADAQPLNETTIETEVEVPTTPLESQVATSERQVSARIEPSETAQPLEPQQPTNTQQSIVTEPTTVVEQPTLDTQPTLDQPKAIVEQPTLEQPTNTRQSIETQPTTVVEQPTLNTQPTLDQPKTNIEQPALEQPTQIQQTFDELNSSPTPRATIEVEQPTTVERPPQTPSTTPTDVKPVHQRFHGHVNQREAAQAAEIRESAWVNRPTPLYQLAAQQAGTTAPIVDLNENISVENNVSGGAPTAGVENILSRDVEAPSVNVPKATPENILSRNVEAPTSMLESSNPVNASPTIETPTAGVENILSRNVEVPTANAPNTIENVIVENNVRGAAPTIENPNVEVGNKNIAAAPTMIENVAAENVSGTAPNVTAPNVENVSVENNVRGTAPTVGQTNSTVDNVDRIATPKAAPENIPVENNVRGTAPTVETRNVEVENNVRVAAPTVENVPVENNVRGTAPTVETRNVEVENNVRVAAPTIENIPVENNVRGTASTVETRNVEVENNVRVAAPTIENISVENNVRGTAPNVGAQTVGVEIKNVSTAPTTIENVPVENVNGTAPNVEAPNVENNVRVATPTVESNVRDAAPTATATNVPRGVIPSVEPSTAGQPTAAENLVSSAAAQPVAETVNRPVANVAPTFSVFGNEIELNNAVGAPVDAQQPDNQPQQQSQQQSQQQAQQFQQALNAQVQSTAQAQAAPIVEGQTTAQLPGESFGQTLNTAVGAPNVPQPTAQAQPSTPNTTFAQQLRDDFNIAGQIVESARMIRNAQNTEMIIHLKPEHLGELTLRVSVTAEGTVNASFHSENAAVRAVIENSLVSLKQELSNQGIKVDNVEVYAGLGDGSSLMNGRGRQGWQQQNRQGTQRVGRVRGGRAVEGGEAGTTSGGGAQAVETAQPVENVISDGAVDYRV